MADWRGVHATIPQWPSLASRGKVATTTSRLGYCQEPRRNKKERGLMVLIV